MIQIKNRFTGNVLFEAEVGSLRLCLQLALKKDANLRGADLGGAIDILSVGPSVDGYMFYAIPQDTGLRIQAGCRWVTMEDARKHWSRHVSNWPQPNRVEINQQRIRFLDFIESEANALEWI